MSVHLTEAERTPASLLDPPSLADEAEEVRAWFVQVRGGAPFLSGADGAALATWLEGGVGVPRILRAIEVTAEVRRARRHRRPFTLKSCGAALEARTAPKRGRRGFQAAVEVAPVARRAETSGLDVPADLAAQLAELRRFALDRLGAHRGEEPDARVRAGCRIAREFHAAVWTALEGERARLIDAAAAALADLAVGLEVEEFEQLCEEHARQRVRESFPELTVERICEEADLGLG